MRYKRSTGATILLILREVYIVANALIMLFPLFYLIICAGKTSMQLVQSPFALPQGFDAYIKNFTSVFTGEIELVNGIKIQVYTPFLLLLKNVVIITAVGLLILVATAIPVGYALGRRQFKGKKAYMMFIILIQTVPLFGYLIAFYFCMDAIKMTNNLFGIGLIYAGVSMPTGILFMKGFFSDFPATVEEAAEIDGAGEAKRFFSIVMPMSKSVIAAIVLVQFMGYWNEFAIANLLITDPNLWTISIAIMHTDSSAIYITYAFALLLLSAVPTFIFFTSFQKGITRGGLSLGSLKG